MLGGLFKQGWQSNSVETRLSSVEKMDSLNANNQAILEELVNNDEQASVRLAALNKLTLPEVVFNISQSHAETDMRNSAQHAFAKLIGIKSNLPEDTLKKLSTTLPAATVLIIQHGKYANIRTELISGFSEIELAEIVAEVEYTDTRVLIAEKIVEIEALELTRKNLKGKDKNAEKIVKEKIDAIHAQQKLDQENISNALLLCEKMEYLADHLAADEWRPEFNGQYSVWRQRWNDSDYTPAEEISQRYSTAYEKVTSAVQEMTKIVDAQAKQQELQKRIELDCSQVATLSLQELHQQQPELSTKLTTLLNDWENQRMIIAPEADMNERFNQAASSLESALTFSQAVSTCEDGVDSLQSAINQLSWNITDANLVSLVETQAQLDELQSEATDKKQADKDKLDKLHKRIHRLLGVTKKGNLAQARRELTAVTKAIEHYSAKDRIILDERLQKANEVVAKMADWNNFVTEPKYLELCDAMEALVGTKTNPDKLAKKIHVLQEQWKGLGYSDSSETHWERFKKAADAAYQPCADFFKQRQTIRRENLTKREPYLAQMRALWEDTEWDESPDYKAIESSVRKIMNDWQTVKDVEQGPGQKQWKKLTKLKSNINEKLDVVYDANIELKNKLISQTDALFELDVNDQTLNKLQLFQSRWKQVGITRRKQDQAAWKSFKKSSDAVYGKIQGLRKEVRAEEDAKINQYRDINNQIQTLAKKTDDLAIGDKQFGQLQSDYAALPDLPDNLPEKLTKKLQLDNRRACENYNKTRERIIQASRSKIIDTLADKAKLCGQLEQLPTDASEEQREKLQTALNAVIIEDKALAKQIDKRIAGAPKCDYKKAAETRRRLCIDLEVLLGVESPVDDKALRMNIQMEKLKNKGLGQGLTLNNETIRQIKIDWLCLPGPDQATQDILDKRFYKLIAGSSKQVRS